MFSAQPKQLPVISTNKDRYGVNDTLTGNCTSSLSYPASLLTFLVNNQSVSYKILRKIAQL